MGHRTGLIIGASRGIGREFARQLLADGWKVYATARDDAALAALRADGAEAIKLDVASPELLAGLGWQLDGIRLDLAVYVAGAYGAGNGATTPPTQDDFDTVMHTNVLGAMQVIPTIGPSVEAGGSFVFLSSQMASIADCSASNGWVYRVSKAALNMTVKAASFDYPGIIMVAMDPGWVRTAMGGPNALISVDESVSGMRKVIAGLTLEDSGTYREYSGDTPNW